ncbi:MAG: FAD-dependent thymidylate synthase [Spirochaetota bacterium]
MAHTVVPAAEEILDHEYRVLDKGFVRLVDYMGGDARIVQSARVSYGEGTKTYRQDAALIDYLLRNEHTSPFEQVVLTFHAKMPLFVARQWVRHRTARLNEISGRYSVMKDEFYVPAGEDIALQSMDNKQGRSDEPIPVEHQERIREQLGAGQADAYSSYSNLLNSGIARELARINLPLSLYTEWYWQIDLHNLFRFVKLRTDVHAQKEIRDYAVTMFSIAKKVCPAACESFERHLLGAVRFSADELAALRSMIERVPQAPGGAADLDTRARAAAEAAGITGKSIDRFVAKVSRGHQL